MLITIELNWVDLIFELWVLMHCSTGLSEFQLSDIVSFDLGCVELDSYISTL